VKESIKEYENEERILNNVEKSLFSAIPSSK